MIQTFVQSLTRGSLVAMVSLLVLMGCKPRPKAPNENTRTESAVTEQESVAAPALMPASGEEKRIEIGIGKAIVLRPEFAVTRAVMRDQFVVDAEIFKLTQVVVRTIDFGQTKMTLIGSNGQSQVYEVHVVAEVPPTANVIRIAPGARTTIETDAAMARITSLSVQIAEIQSVSETKVSVVGHNEGETQVLIFTVDDRILIYDVIVAKDTGP